jgi:hypothetical protein
MRNLILSLSFIAVAVSASAQDHYGYLSWNFNLPLSNTDFIKDGSSAGGKVGYRFQIRDSRFSVGVDGNWATFDEYAPPETFTTPGSAITTDYFKYIYNFGIVVSGQYNYPLGDKQIFIPYGGLGLGANYNVYKLYYNVYEEEESKAGFLVRPEAGMLIRFGEHRSLGALVGVSYDFSTNKSEQYGYDNFTGFGFQLGIILMNR